MLGKTKRRMSRALQVLIGSDLKSGSMRKIPDLTKEEVEEAKSFFPMDKFFIFGHARSGTTLLARLVRLHPEVHCNWQAHFFTRDPLLQGLVNDEEIRSWFSRRSNRWNRGSDFSPIALRAVSDFMLERDARQAGKSVVGDKSPNSLLNGKSVELLHQIYPDGRLIYLVRDGRDTVISHRFQSFVDKVDHLSGEDAKIRGEFIQDPQPFMDGRRSIFTEEGLNNAAVSWVKNLVETDSKGQELFGESYFPLRYEDLLDNPAEEMNRVWVFLGVDQDVENLGKKISVEMSQNPDADWQQETAGQIAQVLQKGRHGSWRDVLTDKDKQIFEQIAGHMLTEWGYDSGVPQGTLN